MAEGMMGVLLALTRSFASLSQRRAWLYLAGPAVVAFILWLLLASYWLGPIVDGAVALPPLSWLVEWGVGWLARFVATIGAWLVILSLIYLTATLLAAVVVLPLMLDWVAANEYPDVARMGTDSLVPSAINSLGSVVLYLVGWLATLPLWLIPGFGLVLPVLWLAWLNRRTFAFDSLLAHATAEESRAIRRGASQPLWILGVLLAMMAFVPILGFVVPTLSALAYLHFTLEALRRQRQGAVVTASAVVIEDEPEGPQRWISRR